MPMILRGVSVLGISSANCDQATRQKVWDTIFNTFSKDEINDFISGSFGLDEISDYSNKMINNKLHGRYVVDLSLI